MSANIIETALEFREGRVNEHALALEPATTLGLKIGVVPNESNPSEVGLYSEEKGIFRF